MKKKYFYWFFYSILGVLLFVGCDYSDNKLRIHNSGDKAICVENSEDSIPTGENLVEYFMKNQIKPKSTENIPAFGKWELYIRDSKNQKLNLFFYDVDTLIKYKNMEYIRANRLYIRRMNLSEDELKKVNWMIVF